MLVFLICLVMVGSFHCTVQYMGHSISAAAVSTCFFRLAPESKHMISSGYPCGLCMAVSPTRQALRMHIHRNHKNVWSLRALCYGTWSRNDGDRETISLLKSCIVIRNKSYCLEPSFLFHFSAWNDVRNVLVCTFPLDVLFWVPTPLGHNYFPLPSRIASGSVERFLSCFYWTWATRNSISVGGAGAGGAPLRNIFLMILLL